MITRRDKLLNKPWEQRKYENHLRKINSAVPVIDNKPPISREHVSIKLKKRQSEIERIRQIENDNLILLRRINYVMNTNRVDNWNIPPQQSKYLKRVPLSLSISRPSTSNYSSNSISSSTKQVDFVDKNHNHLRKSKCLACSPHIIPPKLNDSERIPWEEPKMYSKRERSKSLPVIKTVCNELNNNNDFKEAIKPASSNGRLKNAHVLPKELKIRKQNTLSRGSSQNLIISSGSLKLCVKFPPYSQIMLNDGCKEKMVFGSRTNVGSC